MAHDDSGGAALVKTVYTKATEAGDAECNIHVASFVENITLLFTENFIEVGIRFIWSECVVAKKTDFPVNAACGWTAHA